MSLIIPDLLLSFTLVGNWRSCWWNPHEDVIAL